jgi:hypothetical protein
MLTFSFLIFGKQKTRKPVNFCWSAKNKKAGSFLQTIQFEQIMFHPTSSNPFQDL